MIKMNNGIRPLAESKSLSSIGLWIRPFWHTPQAKFALFRQHLADKVSVADLWDEYKIQPSLFYQPPMPTSKVLGRPKSSAADETEPFLMKPAVWDNR